MKTRKDSTMKSFMGIAFVAGLLLSAVPFLSHAGTIITGAKIVEMDNTGISTDLFCVKPELQQGGTWGVDCPSTNNGWVCFPVTRAASQKAFDRAYASALTAMINDYLVELYTTESNTGLQCNAAQYIRLSK